MNDNRNYFNGSHRLAKSKLELFAIFKAAGRTLAKSYELAIAKPGTTHKSAAVGGSRLAAIPGVRARIAYLREQRFATDNIPPPANILPDTAMMPKTPREMLLTRLWQAVRSGSKQEAIGALKLIRVLLRKDVQAAPDATWLDPVVICQHLAQDEERPVDREELSAILQSLCACVGVTMSQIANYRRSPVPAPVTPDSVPSPAQSVVESVAIQEPVTPYPCYH